MEYALRVCPCLCNRVYGSSLNPCFNGICSAREGVETTSMDVEVLILVLMEYALRAKEEVSLCKQLLVLILVLMEYALRDYHREQSSRV